MSSAFVWDERYPQTWREFTHARFTGRDKSLPRMNKFEVYEFLDRYDFPHPRVIRQWESVDDIALSDLPDRFVVKPISLAAMRGVTLLSREKDSLYFDWATQVHWKESEIVEYQRYWFDQWKKKRKGKY